MTAKKAERRLFRVTFHNQSNVYEIYARGVSHGSLLGFVEIEHLVFGERSQVVVDPSEERLREEFRGVRRLYVPVHAVIRIDEVEKQGSGKVAPIEKGDRIVTPFPSPFFDRSGK